MKWMHMLNKPLPSHVSLVMAFHHSNRDLNQCTVFAISCGSRNPGSPEMTLICDHLFVLFGSWFETQSHPAQDGFET